MSHKTVKFTCIECFTPVKNLYRGTIFAKKILVKQNVLACTLVIMVLQSINSNIECYAGIEFVGRHSVTDLKMVAYVWSKESIYQKNMEKHVDVMLQ